MRGSDASRDRIVEYRLMALLLWCYSMLFAVTILAVWFGILKIPFQWSLTLSLALLPFAFAVLHASRTIGWGYGLFLLFLTVTVTLFLESVGVLTGVIFGSYHYTALLGPRLLGLVPYMVPVAWFALLYPSYVIGEWLVPARWAPWRRQLAVAALGATVITTVDIVIDPVMVAAGYWIWQVKGAFFGVPAHNYFGWWLTTFVILGLYLCFSGVGSKRRLGRSPSLARLAMFSYATIGFGAVAIASHMRLEGPALAALLAMGFWLAAGLLSTRATRIRSQDPGPPKQKDIGRT